MDLLSVIRDSSVIQELMEQNFAERAPALRADAVRTMLLRQGRKRFGEPDAATLAALEAIVDVERLERMGEAILDVPGWAELLATA